jgi:hypothetical protein
LYVNEIASAVQGGAGIDDQLFIWQETFIGTVSERLSTFFNTSGASDLWRERAIR